MSIQSVLTRRSAGYPSVAFTVLGCLLCVAAVIHLGLGARTIAPRVVVDALLHYDPHNFDHRIIVSLRLTRLLAALMTGAALGVAGLLLLPGYSLVWLIFAGLGAGSSLVLALSFFGLRSSHHHQATQLSGMAQSVGYLLAALGPTLFGLLHDLTQGWRLPLMVLLCLTLLQMLFGMLAGRNQVIR